MPEPVDLSAALDEEASDVPASVADCVVEEGADRAAGCFEVGAAGDERVGYIGVVAAGGPVQRGLGPVPARVNVRIGAASMSSRTMAGPLGK